MKLFELKRCSHAAPGRSDLGVYEQEGLELVAAPLELALPRVVLREQLHHLAAHKHGLQGGSTGEEGASGVGYNLIDCRMVQCILHILHRVRQLSSSTQNIQ